MASFSPKNRMPNVRCLAAGLLLALATSHAYGQSAAAPAMFDVEEVVVQFTHFGNDKIAETCGLSQQDLEAILIKTLTDNGVPATGVSDAKPPVLGRARVDLMPDIYSLNSEGLDCTSWVSLTAETHNSVHVPPVDVARNVSIVYWREGTLLSSGQTTHERMISDTLQKLARRFAQQYKLDQPPPAPNQ